MAHHVIALQATDPYRSQSYGVVFESTSTHHFTSRVHNPHHDHSIEVWVNRANRDGQLIDPFGNPTEDAVTVTTSPHATVIALAKLPSRFVRGEELAVGDTVELTLDGRLFGIFEIAARPLHNPHLVRATAEVAR